MTDRSMSSAFGWAAAHGSSSTSAAAGPSVQIFKGRGRSSSPCGESAHREHAPRRCARAHCLVTSLSSWTGPKRAVCRAAPATARAPWRCARSRARKRQQKALFGDRNTLPARPRRTSHRIATPADTSLPLAKRNTSRTCIDSDPRAVSGVLLFPSHFESCSTSFLPRLAGRRAAEQSRAS
jgi:hypothetical protein